MSDQQDPEIKRHSLQISLDVVAKRSLEESLDFYCQGELMEGDNQYFCEEAGRKVRAATVILWQTAPLIL